jgi:hypothetical protein
MRCRLAVFAFAATLAAQPPASLFDGLRWRMIGPFRGGRSIAATGVPGDPNIFYFGAVGGGIWKTTNAGLTWSRIFDDQHVASIGAIEVAPSDLNIIYAGTGEADIRSDLSQGDGDGTIDAAFRVGAVGVTERSDVDDIGVGGMNQNSPDLMGIAQPDVAPGFSGVGGLYKHRRPVHKHSRAGGGPAT